jgi:hypothetical protein
MAVILGFVVVFIAGVAIAYFAGRHAPRPSIPAVPARSPSAAAANSTTPTPDLDAASAVLVSDKQALEDPAFCEQLPGSPALEKEQQTLDEKGFETRRFKRLEFSGTAQATIYPHKHEPGSEPIRCEVLTRDLSQGGIGIGHTQRLLPQQMIVLDAVGKLLVGEVRWCRRVEKDLYFVGCRLVKTTT